MLRVTVLIHQHLGDTYFTSLLQASKVSRSMADLIGGGSRCRSQYHPWYQLFSRQCSKPFELTLYFQSQICQRPICFLIRCKYTKLFLIKQIFHIFFYLIIFTLFIYSNKNIITGHGKTGISLPFHTGP